MSFFPKPRSRKGSKEAAGNDSEPTQAAGNSSPSSNSASGFFLASAPMKDPNGVPMRTIISAVTAAGGYYSAGFAGDELNKELEDAGEKW